MEKLKVYDLVVSAMGEEMCLAFKEAPKGA